MVTAMEARQLSTNERIIKTKEDFKKVTLN